MYEVWKEFGFDAAHTLEGGTDPRYQRLHGHSYQVEVWVRGPKAAPGWVIDMGELDRRVTAARAKVDHTFLNEVEGLGPPTMENIASYLWQALADLTGLWKIVVRRDQSREGCVYRGPARVRSARA